MTIRLAYYALEDARDGFGGIDRRDHPEFHLNYTTAAAAMAAGEVVFARMAEKFRASLAARSPMLTPEEAKRSWDSPAKSSCFVETRIVSTRIEWTDASYRDREEWSGRMTIKRESRHRWREVEMRTEVAKNGVTTITHALGKALPWGKWHDGCDGNPYVPPEVQVIVRPHWITLAGDAADLAAWIATGDAK